MKKLIILSIIMSLFATAAQSQVIVIPEQDPPGDWPGGGPGNPGVTNQYPYTTGTITKSGYTYKYRNDKIAGREDPDSILLYNADTSFLDVEWGNKDGTELTLAEAMGLSESYYVSRRTHTDDQLREIVAGCFTSQQKTALKGSSMIIETPTDPLTGKIADVYFSFSRDEPLVNIPVETFRSIELALKQKFTATTTARGKKLNYLPILWLQEF